MLFFLPVGTNPSWLLSRRMNYEKKCLVIPTYDSPDGQDNQSSKNVQTLQATMNVNNPTSFDTIILLL